MSRAQIDQFQYDYRALNELQDKIFRRKRLSTGANFVHVYIEIWDKVYLNLFNFSIPKVK